MLLAVKPHVLIPHVVTWMKQSFSFNPTAEVPDEFAESALKAFPKVYCLPEELPADAKHPVKDSFAGKSLQEIFVLLPPERKARLMAYAQALVKEEEPPLPAKEEEKKKRPRKAEE